MTIQEVPSDVLAEMLLAVQDLRRKYLGELQVTVYEATCSICYYDTQMCRTRGGVFCSHCPWRVIEGHHCGEFAQHDSLTYDDFPIPERLKRVDRWEAIITAELAARQGVQS